MISQGTEHSRLPVAILGADPVGLSGAAHLINHVLSIVIFEAGKCGS
ncbi:hypothetical protein [Domibacillus epiphyticus]|nr:hypothetical protein [Domibacillus epiphyticus]